MEIKVIPSADQQEPEVVKEALFLPHMDDASAKNGTCLLYCPLNILMFLKYFYAVYERVMKAKDLIREKIQSDLADMSKEEKMALGIAAADGSPNQQTLDLFFRERYEYLLKGIFATTTSQTCSGVSSNTNLAYSNNTHNHFLLD
mmetsp:Transcript_28671/g.43292  ORF Transcript_28671/g.43292 Transcript_28671/m.43292 type:complete len:145 (+) Transcript_28671:3777-4211(+)